MKILVTGGAGFIGSHVIEKLVQEQCQVVVIDNLSTGRRENVPPGIQFVELDICSENLLELFAQQCFDVVIHLAAQTMVPVSLDRPDYDCQVNIRGTVNVLEACRKTKVKRIVFSSSAAVYGNAVRVPIGEEAVTMPTSFYGLSKLTAEQYLDMYQQRFGLEYAILRYANVYGERQGDGGEGGVISIFTRKISQGESLVIYGDGGQTRDFIYAGDVASANYQAVMTPNRNQIYNISTQREVSINQLLKILEEIAGQKVNKAYSAVRPGDIYRSTLCNQKSWQGLSWKPAISLAEGLALTYGWQAMKK